MDRHTTAQAAIGALRRHRAKIGIFRARCPQSQTVRDWLYVATIPPNAVGFTYTFTQYRNLVIGLPCLIVAAAAVVVLRETGPARAWLRCHEATSQLVSELSQLVVPDGGDVRHELVRLADQSDPDTRARLLAELVWLPQRRCVDTLLVGEIVSGTSESRVWQARLLCDWKHHFQWQGPVRQIRRTLRENSHLLEAFELFPQSAAAVAPWDPGDEFFTNIERVFAAGPAAIGAAAALDGTPGMSMQVLADTATALA